mmetsp:Transcript_12047/g.19466  ORF Transcript_12047/g.19466 Transcript_12047/m.19466 type:complete len:83 (+) Transcript_12047:41-289(+)
MEEQQLLQAPGSAKNRKTEYIQKEMSALHTAHHRTTPHHTIHTTPHLRKNRTTQYQNPLTIGTVTISNQALHLTSKEQVEKV